MPRQPMILRTHFYHAKGQGQQSLASGAHHASYIADPNKAELLVDDRTSLESAAIHAQYADERHGSMGSFGSVSTAQAQREIRRHTQAPVWRFIVSVGEQDALAMPNGLTTKAGWETATRAVLPVLIRSMGLDPSKVQWNAAAHRRQHRGENNPHIHLLVWERGTPSRRTGALTPDAIAKVRRAFAQVLYRPELERVSAAKTQARAEAKATTQTLLRVIHGGQREGIDLEQGFVKAMTTRLQALGEHLPPKGRLAYGYMPTAVKQEVLDLARWLTDYHEGLRRAKAQFLESAETYTLVHWSPPDSTDWGGPEQEVKRQNAIAQARAKAERDLYERLASSLLTAAAQAANDPPPLMDGIERIADDRPTEPEPTNLPDVAAPDLTPLVQAPQRDQDPGHRPSDAPQRGTAEPARAKVRGPIDQPARIVHPQRPTQRAQAATLRGLLRAAVQGVHGLDYAQRHAAYLSAKGQWARKHAEWELAAAQGMDVAL